MNWSSLRERGLLPLLALLCVARLWLMPLPSSFWLDEMATVFVARYGSNHPSLAGVAPQAWQSIYYPMARAAGNWLGGSEAAYRLPSVLAMALALWLVSRLASRLIHPGAGWFAVFACFALGGLNYHAADARPYALGMAVAAAAMLFLVRWADSGRRRDALLFVLFAALLWRVHLLFWPVYVVFALYAAVRLRKGRRVEGLLVFALVALALVPVLLDALALYRDAGAHVFARPPGPVELARAIKWPLVAGSGLAAWLLSRRREKTAFPPGAWVLTLGWWLAQPLCLFAFSRLAGASIFVPRYLSIALPGAALAATAAAARFTPPSRWKLYAALLGIGALLATGQWRQSWPRHHNSDWRAAAAAVNALPATLVLCPSPFVEAAPPLWSPDYALPGFLYAHLAVYPLRHRVYLFPFQRSNTAEEYAATLSRTSLYRNGRFALYGWEPQVNSWRDWFAVRPEFAGWRSARLGSFADVEVVVFEK